MRMRKRLAGITTALALTGAGVFFAAAPASADSGYNGACGSGYTVIDQEATGQGQDGAGGVTYLTYNSSNGYNCVVTVNTTGTTEWLDARVEVHDGTWVLDDGHYQSYAGPVYVYAAGQCIDWGGGEADYQYAPVFIAWDVHCG